MELKNIYTGEVKTLEEYEQMLKNDAIEKYSIEDEEIMDLDIFDFKQNGGTLEEYIKMYVENNFDSDWKVIK